MSKDLTEERMSPLDLSELSQLEMSDARATFRNRGAEQVGGLLSAVAAIREVYDVAPAAGGGAKPDVPEAAAEPAGDETDKRI